MVMHIIIDFNRYFLCRITVMLVADDMFNYLNG